MSHNINEYIRRVGVHEFRVKVLHSFRDTVSDALGESDMDDAAADRWTGHAPRGVKGQAYRSAAPTKSAGKAYKALSWDIIPWSKLKYPKGRWNKHMKLNMVD